MDQAKGQLSEREAGICRRLREFREQLQIPRTKFAVSLGISPAQLAHYEYCKARVPYGVYARIAERHRLNAHWLANGNGPTTAVDCDFVFHEGSARNPLFSEVFDAHSRDDRAFFGSSMEDVLAALHLVLGEALQRLPTSGGNFLTPAQHAQLGEALIAASNALLPAIPSKVWENAIAGESLNIKAILDNRSPRIYKNVMPVATSPLTALLRRLKVVTNTRGAQTRLAREMKVSRQAVHNWISGGNSPTADIALRLLKWIEAEESKQKQTAGSVTARPAVKTRERQSSHEKPNPSPRKK